MKKLILVFFLSFNFFFTKSQTNVPQGFKIGAAISLAIPVSNLTYNTIGAGFDILAQYGLSNNLALTADVGATALFAKYNIPTTAVIPIRLGIKYFPSPAVYLGAKAGLGIYTLGNVVSENYAAWSLGAGYIISRRFDVSAAYEGYSKKNVSFGYAGLRLGYTFGK